MARGLREKMTPKEAIHYLEHGYELFRNTAGVTIVYRDEEKWREALRVLKQREETPRPPRPWFLPNISHPARKIAKELDPLIEDMALRGADFSEGEWVVICPPAWRKQFNHDVFMETGGDIEGEPILYRSKIGKDFLIETREDAPPGQLIIMEKGE